MEDNEDKTRNLVNEFVQNIGVPFSVDNLDAFRQELIDQAPYMSDYVPASKRAMSSGLMDLILKEEVYYDGQSDTYTWKGSRDELPVEELIPGRYISEN